jgi:hypothetical protein
LGGSQFQASFDDKRSQDPISTEEKLGMVVNTTHSSQGRKHKIESSQSRLAQAKNETLSPK